MVTTEKDELSCYDFPEVSHCISCHEDVDYGYELGELERNGFVIIGCCTGREYVEKLTDEEFKNRRANEK